MKSYGATLSFALRTRRGNLLKFQENSLLAFADNGDINTTKNVHTRWGPIFRSGLISASPWGKKRTARSNTACAWTHPRARRGPETAHAASLRSSRCAALRERKKNTRLFDAMGVGGRLSGREIAFWERHHWRLAAAYAGRLLFLRDVYLAWIKYIVISSRRRSIVPRRSHYWLPSSFCGKPYQKYACLWSGYLSAYSFGCRSILGGVPERTRAGDRDGADTLAR